MVERRLDERRYTDVAMPTNQGDAAGALMSAATRVGGNIFELVQARDRMNMNNMLSDANTEMAQLTSKWQIENASNPFDPQAAEKLKLGYADIFNKYGEKVSITSRGDWAESQGKLTSQYVQSNMRWGAGQAIRNAEASVNMSFKKNNAFAYESAVAGTDVGLVNGKLSVTEDLVRKSLKTIGQSDQQIDETLSNHRSDYMKNYVTGAIFRDPDKGVQLLEDKKIKEDIGSPEAIKSLSAYAGQRKQQIRIETQRANDATAFADLEALYDQNIPFSAKIADIEEKQLKGVYSSTTAANMRRVLTSRQAVDAVTDDSLRTGILQRVSDAYVEFDGGGKIEDYFTKMEEIRTDLTAANSTGKFDSKEVLKINNQIEQMTRKATSEATLEMKDDKTYKDAIKYFKDTVPPSYQDSALREYFFMSDAATMPKDKAKKLMNEIAVKARSDFLSKTAGDIVPSFANEKEYKNKKASLKKGQIVNVAGKQYRVK